MRNFLFLLQVLLLLTIWVASEGVRCNRLKRQSPFQEGMRMFESFRGDVQKGFNSIMDRLMHRGSLRGILRPRRPQFILPPNAPRHPPQGVFQPLPARPSHSKPPATSSSFAVFNGDQFVTPRPHFRGPPEASHFDSSSSVHVLDHQQAHHHNHVPHQFHHKNEENEISNNILIHQKNKNDQLNHVQTNEVEPPKGKEEFHNSFVGSVESPPNQIPKTSDGWVALPPPFSSKPLVVQAKKIKTNGFEDNKISSDEYQKQLVSTFQLPKAVETKGIAISSAIKLHESYGPQSSPNFSSLQLNKGQFVGQKALPAQETLPVFREDIKRPLHSKLARELFPEKKTTQFSQGIQHDLTNRRNGKSATSNISRQLSNQNVKGTLVDRGIKIELAEDKRNVS